MASKKRMIYADAFWNQLQQVVYDIVENDDFGCLQLGYSPDIIEEVLNQIPTVDATEVVHGQWVRDEWGDFVKRCSVCGEVPNAIPGSRNEPCYSPYCPNCGADMRGVHT